MNFICKILPWLCPKTNNIEISKQPKEDFKDTIRNDNFLKQPIDNFNSMNKSEPVQIDITELKRAVSEFKSARTLIKKALMRVNSNNLGDTLYNLDVMITKLEIRIKKM